MERTERVIVTDMNKVTEADFESANWGDSVDGSYLQPKFSSVAALKLQPKFSSVAALKLHQFTLESFQDESHGNTVDWHRWSALFRNVTDSDSPNTSEQPAAILHTDPQGFVSAEWYADGNAAEEVWGSLEKEWEEYDDQPEDEGDDEE